MMSAPSISALTAGMSFSACTQARTKKPMKPSLTPCRFSNSVLVLVAQRHHRAHVDLVEGREHGGGVLRLLQAPRDGLAQPRHLARAPRARHRRPATARAPAPRRRSAAPASGCAAARSIAAIMSPLVTRPSLPEPATAPGSTPLSAAMLAHRRRERHVAGCALRRGLRRPRGPASIGAVVEVFWSGRPVGAGGLRARRAGALLDLAEQRADRDGLAVLRRDLGRARPRPAPAPRSSPCRFRARPAARRPRRLRPAS